MFPFDRALRYARLLVTQADAIDRSHQDLQAAVEAALGRWRGGHADEMADERLPEQEADVSAAAVHGLRLEAEAWATAWADAVNAYNRRRHAAALREHEQLRSPLLLAAGIGAGIGGEVGADAGLGDGGDAIAAPPEPPVVGAPEAPGFIVGDAFARYRFEPGVGGGPGWWHLALDRAPLARG